MNGSDKYFKKYLKKLTPCNIILESNKASPFVSLQSFSWNVNQPWLSRTLLPLKELLHQCQEYSLSCSCCWKWPFRSSNNKKTALWSLIPKYQSVQKFAVPVPCIHSAARTERLLQNCRGCCQPIFLRKVKEVSNRFVFPSPLILALRVKESWLEKLLCISPTFQGAKKWVVAKIWTEAN